LGRVITTKELFDEEEDDVETIALALLNKASPSEL